MDVKQYFNQPLDPVEEKHHKRKPLGSYDSVVDPTTLDARREKESKLSQENNEIALKPFNCDLASFNELYTDIGLDQDKLAPNNDVE